MDRDRSLRMPIRCTRRGKVSAPTAFYWSMQGQYGGMMSRSRKALPALESCRVTWLEEPFVSGALRAYRELAKRSVSVRLAGGEGCHTFRQAQNLIDFGGIGYVQIDAGRIGGLTTAKAVADCAADTDDPIHEPYLHDTAGLERLCSAVCGVGKSRALRVSHRPLGTGPNFSSTKITPDSEGLIQLPEGPGSGLEPDPEALRGTASRYEIKVDDRILFQGGRIGALRRAKADVPTGPRK